MNRHSTSTGLSLVEVTLAIGIVGFALLAIIGLVPVGLKSSGDAIDATRTSFICQDAQNRVRARVDYAMFAAAPDISLTLFYDRDGIFVGTTASTRALYRVDATIHGDWGSGAVPPTLDPSVLRPVTMQLRWPLAANGNPIGTNVMHFPSFVRRP